MFAALYMSTLVALDLWRISDVDAYPALQDQLPNGHDVPNPCRTDSIWQGVGHQNDNGSGALNAFGVDFKASQFVSFSSIGEIFTRAIHR